MYRLLIVDDEEIITDSLYEVFSRLMPDELDVCRAYFAKEALGWLSRTRVDIVLTDIRMPGMSGLELMEEIQLYWPRCRIIFLTGHSEFDYAYHAMKLPSARYLLKTEGYSKVIETVQEVIREIRQGEQAARLIDKSREQIGELEFMRHGDYFRRLIQAGTENYLLPQELSDDFHRLNIGLDPHTPVVMALGHLRYPEGMNYNERRDQLASARMIGNSYLAERTRSIGFEDKYGDIVWLIQAFETVDGKFNNHLIRYLEGTLELIQDASLESLGLTISFIVGSSPCGWTDIGRQYERLRRLQRMKSSDGLAMVLTDRDEGETSNNRNSIRIQHKVETMSSHLEACKADEYLAGLDEAAEIVLQDANVSLTIETYYSIALQLLSSINRWGLHVQISDYGKLMRLDDHPTMQEGFQYLCRIAERILNVQQNNDRDRATKVIDRICRHIDDHLDEDLSLVRLAEIHYFNPSYLSRFFKQEMGINLSEYIDNCRVKKSKELLRVRELKVKEVALAVGYEAAHSFTRFFKKATGLSPQEYREQLTGAEA